MIDWWFVFVSSLWIVGAAIIFAAFSYLDWWAQETGTTRRELFGRPGWRVPFNGGLLLVCLGVGLGQGRAWWEQAIWALIGAASLWFFAVAAREMWAESRARAVTAAATDSTEASAVSRPVCPRCRSARVHRSRTRGPEEEHRKLNSAERPYRCHDCGWRDWIQSTVADEAS